MSEYENDDDDDDDDVHHEKSNNELHIACNKGDLIQVQTHVRNFDINAQGKDAETALLIAATEGHIEIVKLLLSFNPDARISNVSIVHSLLYFYRYLSLYTSHISSSPILYVLILYISLPCSRYMVILLCLWPRIEVIWKW